MKFFFSTLIMLSLFTIISAAQETEDVVYLKNGSIIRGTITELTPNINLKIETRDGSLFVFKMSEVEKVVKEPVLMQSLQTTEKKGITTFSETQQAAFGGLLLGAHSSLGMNLPFIGAMGLYDTEIDLSALSNTGSARGRIGVIGNVEYSFAKAAISDIIDADADLFLASALACLGFQSTENSVFRIGGGVSFISVEAEVLSYGGSVSGVTPTAMAAWTFYPKTEDRESFALTFSVRWQGEGVMFAITPGILQQGAGR